MLGQAISTPNCRAIFPTTALYDCTGSLRFFSRTMKNPRRQSRSHNNSNRGRNASRQADDWDQHKGSKRSTMVYYVMPDPPKPPKFDVKILGTGWTVPSTPPSKHPIVGEVLRLGKIGTKDISRWKDWDAANKGAKSHQQQRQEMTKQSALPDTHEEVVHPSLFDSIDDPKFPEAANYQSGGKDIYVGSSVLDRSGAHKATVGEIESAPSDFKFANLSEDQREASNTNQ